MKHETIWVLIADGGRARLLATSGTAAGLHQVPETSETWLLPPSRDIFADRPGRSFDSTGHARHAMEPTSDPHRELKRAFAQHLADNLAARLAEGAFDKLVVVAPPVTLGDLRAAFAKPVGDVVIGEVAADLTRTPTDEIGGHLLDVLR